MEHIKLEHELLAAHWEDTTGKWRLKIRAKGANETEDTADVLILATGILNRWQWPRIEGLSDFQGTLLHSANWKGEIDDWKDKTVGVIGVVGAIHIPSLLSGDTTDVHWPGLVGLTNCPRSTTKSETHCQLCPFKDVVQSSLGIFPPERVNWEGEDGYEM
jgi:hypothetical protein